MSISTPAATAPTEPVPPAASTEPVPPAAPDATAGVTPAGATPPPVAQRTPWYRRAWAIAVAVALLAVLSFGSGFVAGNTASVFGGLIGGPGGGFDGPRFPDGVRPGDGQPPQFRGDATSQGDGS